MPLDDKMPPLPEPSRIGYVPLHELYSRFTADQMHAYGRQCAEAAFAEQRERDAEIAERNGQDEPYGHAKFRCYHIAEEIRGGHA